MLYVDSFLNVQFGIMDGKNGIFNMVPCKLGMDIVI